MINQNRQLIWIIFECDARSSFDTYCIKVLSADQRFVEKEFERLSSSYVLHNPDNWILNLAIYNPSVEVRITANVFFEFEVVKSTKS